MSLKWVKWVWCTNHNLTQHDTSEKPSESPTTTTVTVRPSISGWGCIHMIASRSSTCWITLFMHDKEVLWVWGGWGALIITLHMLQVIVQDNHLMPLRLGDKAISCWGCIHMTTSHNRRIRNASYRYEEDMIGVWIGWGISIIVYSMIQVRNRVNLLLLLLWLVTVRPSISGWGCIHMIASHSSTCWISLYMHDKEVLWVWIGWDVGCLNHNLTHDTSEKTSGPTETAWDQAYIRLRLHPYDVEGAETLYICIK